MLTNLTADQRNRIETALQEMRDLHFAAAAACLAAFKAVHMGRENDDALVANVIGKQAELAVLSHIVSKAMQ